MTPWITVIGITDRGLPSLPPGVGALVEKADVLVGGQRHLDLVDPSHSPTQITWSDGLDAAYDQIARHEGHNVVVLASGDPLHYGIGDGLVRRFGTDAIHVIPAPGAFSLAAARMKWSLPDVTCLTVHGRPLESVNLHLAPGARLLLLSWDGTTAKALARLLTDKGYGKSSITVLEHMEGEKENRIEGIAEAWPHDQTASLNTIAVTCIAGPDAVYWPRVPGLPETAFLHDGKITKREVRAATLAALAPMPGETLWDVGAGSGAVGIEWMRCPGAGKTTAFEIDPDKKTVIEKNARSLGVPDLEIVTGDVLETLPTRDDQPDALFVGGGVSRPDVMALCLNLLNPGGRLVANGVTLEAHQNLMYFHQIHGGDLVRISVARSGSVGSLSAMRPAMDVLQWKVTKQ